MRTLPGSQIRKYLGWDLKAQYVSPLRYTCLLPSKLLNPISFVLKFSHTAPVLCVSAEDMDIPEQKYHIPTWAPDSTLPHCVNAPTSYQERIKILKCSRKEREYINLKETDPKKKRNCEEFVAWCVIFWGFLSHYIHYTFSMLHACGTEGVRNQERWEPLKGATRAGHMLI